MLALVSSLAASPWLISLEHAQAYMPLLAGLLTSNVPTGADVAGRNLAELRAEAAPKDLMVKPAGLGSVSYAARGVAADGSGAGAGADETIIRVLRAEGPLMKADQFCGPLGLMSLASSLQRTARDPEIGGVVLRVDSPGGQVYGTQSVADGIRACQQAGKPVVALVDDGLMCSAAYWIGASCDTIIATHETCCIGSIGVMASWADAQPYFEKLGVKFHEVYAAQSSQKNADFAAASKGDYKALQGQLTAIADGFLSHVRQSRAGRLDEKAFQQSGAAAGKTFFASQAGEIGLIDAMGSFSDALAECARLARKNPENS